MRWTLTPRPEISSSSTRTGPGQRRTAKTTATAYVKRQCMHCVHPACVSACPVSAMKKDPRHGDRDLRQGCLHRLPLLPGRLSLQHPEVRVGPGLPADPQVPALPPPRQGRVRGLRRVLPRRRDGLRQGRRTCGPRRSGGSSCARGTSPGYPLQRVGSGTSVESRVDPLRADRSTASRKAAARSAWCSPGCPSRSSACAGSAGDGRSPAKSETIQHTLYKGMIAPGVLLAGLLFAA